MSYNTLHEIARQADASLIAARERRSKERWRQERHRLVLYRSLWALALMMAVAAVVVVAMWLQIGP
jgi:anti-sigma-K factor RskA